MKKLIVLIAALLAALFVVGCASGPTANDSMSSASDEAPAGTLVGKAIGATVQQAEQRAKLQLVNGMINIARALITDQTGSTLQSSVANDFQTGVTTALGNSSLSGAQKVGSGQDKTKAKTAWAVYYMDKSEVLKEITDAVNQAKKLVAAGNFNPNQGFDVKYNAVAK